MRKGRIVSRLDEVKRLFSFFRLRKEQKSSMNKVSIIVTSYNHEKYIAQCLHSIFNQNYSSIELIIIDDGSIDGSVKVIERLITESPFAETYFYTQENQGPCVARNRGLDLATGNFIMIVDSDDFLDKSHVTQSLEILEKEQKDIAYCSQRDAETLEIVNEVPEFSLGRFITANYIGTSTLIRTSAIKDHRFDLALNRVFMEDYDFYLSLIADGAKAVKVPNLYLNYRIIKNSINNRGSKRPERVKWLEVYSYINGKYPEFGRNATNLIGSWYLEANDEINQLSTITDKKIAMLNKEKEYLYQQHQSNEKELLEKKEYIDLLNNQYQQLDQLYVSIVNSKSWKIGRVMTHGYRKLLSIARRIKSKHTPKAISANSYQEWINLTERKEIIDAERVTLDYQPLISILVPVYNVEKKWLLKCVSSIQAQTYENWELCLADDCSDNLETIETLHTLEKSDPRIRVVYRKKNGNISLATNSALELAKGEFIALVDNDDELPSNALFEVVHALNEDSNLDLIYSDEDKINQDGVRFEPHFKPNWSPDLILNQNYISHLGIYRRSIANEIGGFRQGYEGAQDHDFLLRFSEKTSRQKIKHIPKILYHWRAIQGSTALEASEKSYAYDRGVRAVQDALDRRGIKGLVTNGKYPGLYDISYDLIGEPLVSIIIPTRNGYDDLKKCVDSIVTKSTYSNFEIIIADNGSDDPEIIKLFTEYRSKLGERFKNVLLDIPFNYSKINNLAVRESRGEYLLFLNNDTEVITPRWIEEMLGFAQFERIGCVGAKLWYMDDTIQHGGVVLGIGGIAGHAFLNAGPNEPGYFSRLYTDYDYTAVTAACLMVSRNDFDAVNGFDESLTVAFNDVDFCIRIFQMGRQNIWAHKAELYHYESKSRGYEDTPEKVARFNGEINRMNARYGKFLKNDPAYNPNFDLNATPFSRLKNI